MAGKTKVPNLFARIYTASFIDGEGCISFSKGRDAFYPRVMLVNSNLDVLKMIQQYFGGNIQKNKIHKIGWKQTYCLKIAHKEAFELINNVYPYLIIKKEQARTYFAWEGIRKETSKNIRRLEDYREGVSLIVDQLKWLNTKGDRTNLGMSPVEIEFNRSGYAFE